MNATVGQLMVLIAVGVSGSALATAADQPPFSIAIGSPQQTWRIGSEVTVTVILTNTSRETVLFRKSFAQDEGELFMDVEVKDDRGNPLPRTKYYRLLRQDYSSDFPRQPDEEFIAGGSVHKYFLKPAETLKDQIVVSRLFDLSRVGKYTIRVQRRDQGTKSLVTSNSITVTVSD